MSSRAASGWAAPVSGAPSQPVVVLRGLGCRYPGGTQALEGIDLEVHRGELVTVMGHTGAGKSTLLRCMAGIVPRLQAAEMTGECRLFGEPLEQLDAARLAGRIGVVFQDFEAQIFSTNAALEVGFGLDQLGLPPGQIRARTAAALERVGLAGFDGRDPVTLSGGEKQRLAIAAVWALEPELVLLDEPTTDIDPLGKAAVLDLLSALRDCGAAVVVVEHEPAAALAADRLVLLSQGRMRACGPSAVVGRDTELLAACGARPRDLDVVAGALGIADRLSDVDQAEAVLRARGFAPRPASGDRVDGPGTDRTERRMPAAAVPGGVGLLELDAVRHVYPGGTAALDGVRLRLAPGELVALIGQNGSGKTTLAKHLNGLLLPTAGRVRLDGVDTRELSLGRIARVVGFVFQDPDHQLFCASVAEEVAFGLRHLGLSAAQLDARVARTLDLCGLGGRRDEDPFLLSKGERQRLAVAAVLALEPRVLILDEPTTGLDDREQRAMLELLREQHRAGRTVVVITHAPWLVAEHAERAVLLAGGRILLDGPVRELFARPDLLRRASFLLPEATRLGLRFGLEVRSAGELALALRQAHGGAG